MVLLASCRQCGYAAIAQAMAMRDLPQMSKLQAPPGAAGPHIRPGAILSLRALEDDRDAIRAETPGRFG
jgi:hypothetical protein